MYGYETFKKLYLRYKSHGMTDLKAYKYALWFASNRQRHFEQGLTYARNLGISGVYVPLESTMQTGITAMAGSVALAG